MLEKDLKIVKKLKHLICRKVKVDEIILFGSRAKENASEESDLDVLIIVDLLDHSIEKYISECAWEIGFSEDCSDYTHCIN
jgi:predicted nucleotidyltransferase